MPKNIWTSPSQYGTYPVDSNVVSDSTARRWMKEDRTKKRQSRSMKRATKALEIVHA